MTRSARPPRPSPPKHGRDLRLQERAARLRLQPQHHPYWRSILAGFHLGYYKGPTKTSWIARLRNAQRSEGYDREVLGEADDQAQADGETILTYAQALDKAMAWKRLVEAGESGRADPGERIEPASLTVTAAVETYIARRNARRCAQAGRTVVSDAQYKLRAHVVADKKIAGLRLTALTEADLLAWQARLALQMPASRQRIVNDFKAALNAAFAAHRRALPADFPTVIKFGLALEAGEVAIARARDNQILEDQVVRAIVEGAMAHDEDFGRLVLLLAATGARFAQLRRMRVCDVQSAQNRLLVPQSFKGKRKTLEYIRVAVGADVIDALAPIIEGRAGQAPLLERWLLRQISVTQWEKVERTAWKSPSEMARPWAKLMAQLCLPAATIPYALRHSSIVRGLRANLPIRLVAALHDTSVVMIERHYSRWITEGLEELVARAVVPLLPCAAPGARAA